MFLKGRRKGQAAIEFLMTYGWMLLVVLIVGALIFSFVDFGSLLPNKIDLNNNLRGDPTGSLATAKDNLVQVVFKYNGRKRVQIDINNSKIKNELNEECVAIKLTNLDTEKKTNFKVLKVPGNISSYNVKKDGSSLTMDENCPNDFQGFDKCLSNSNLNSLTDTNSIYVNVTSNLSTSIKNQYLNKSFFINFNGVLKEGLVNKSDDLSIYAFNLSGTNYILLESTKIETSGSTSVGFLPGKEGLMTFNCSDLNEGGGLNEGDSLVGTISIIVRDSKTKINIPSKGAIRLQVN